jgi:serine/threonine protein kinase
MTLRENYSLKYPPDWKFDGVGIEIPPEAINEVSDLAENISGGSKEIIEVFKHAFGVNSVSSTLDWATSDMHSAIRTQGKKNAAVFVESLWKGIKIAEASGHLVPSVNTINKILEKHGIPLKIDPPNLLRLDVDSIVSDVIEEESEPATTNRLPTYKIGKKVGQGGYGVVFKATRLTSAGTFEYALKILDPSPFVTDFEKALKRFRKEIAVLSVLQHRSIVQYFDAGIFERHKPYIVMPFIEGLDLKEATSGRDLDVIIPLFKEILSGIEYAHSHDVLHRDLKPSNILVRNSDRQPIILDFGSAYVLDQMDSHTLTTQSVGTIGYIPSEVLNDPKKRSKLHDIYACGMMLYEVVAGRRPDPADYKPLSAIDPKYQAVDGLVKKAIAGESSRLASATEFLKGLEQL